MYLQNNVIIILRSFTCDSNNRLSQYMGDFFPEDHVKKLEGCNFTAFIFKSIFATCSESYLLITMTQIYKVFINNYFIFFSSSLNKVDFLNARLALDSVIIIKNYANLMKLLFQKNFHLDNNILFISDNPKVRFNQFKLNFNYITAAGGVVQNNNRDILMIYKRGNSFSISNQVYRSPFSGVN